MKNFLLYILFIILTGCANNNEQPIASAFDNKLYIEDLEGYFNQNLGSSDSIKLLNRVVNLWVMQQVKLVEAEKIGLKNEKINKLVEDYRQQLLVSSLNEEYVAQNIDTAISEDELRNYFDQNKEHFLLSKNILKLVFVKVPVDQKELTELKKLVKRAGFKDKEELMEFCITSGLNCFLDDNIWLDFNEVIKEIPIKTYDVENFLQNNTYTEVKDGNYVYLVKIKDFKIKNASSEFDFERENIKKVLLNSRKNNLLKKYDQDLMQKALNNNKIQININE